MASTPTHQKMCELCEITSSKRIYAADYKPEGVPFYRGKEISEKHRGNLDVSTELFIDRSKFEQIRAKFGAPKAGDLLLTSVGTLGSPYVVDDGEEFYFKDGNLTWFRNFKNLDSRFLYYWLLSPQGKAELKKCTIGSSQSAYTIVLLKEMDIYLLDLPTQCKIAAILSAYDDLIENNLRRIKILEEMAQNLYREWFVKFRFPGHQQSRFVDSPLGRIPEGWNVKALGDLIRFSNGKSIKPGGSGIYKVFGANGVIGGSDEYRFENAVIIGRVGAYCGAVTCCRERFWASDNTIVAQPRVDTFCLDTAFYFLHNLNLNAYAGGAAQPLLTQTTLYKLEIVMPSSDIECLFADFVGAIQTHLSLLRSKNDMLRRTRDLLLPQLISGEVDVSELEITIPEEAGA